MDLREDDPETIYVWPTCAQCSRPRQTICPYCGTAGHEFGPAYGVDPAQEQESAGRPDRIPVVCPTCDEAFWTRFHVRCAWCGAADENGPDDAPDRGPSTRTDLADAGALLVLGKPDRTAAGVGLPIYKASRKGGCGGGCGCAAPQPADDADEAASGCCGGGAKTAAASPYAAVPGRSREEAGGVPRIGGPKDSTEGDAAEGDSAAADAEENADADESDADAGLDPRSLEVREAQDRLVAQRAAVLIGAMSLGGALLTGYFFWIGGR